MRNAMVDKTTNKSPNLDAALAIFGLRIAFLITYRIHLTPFGRTFSQDKMSIVYDSKVELRKDSVALHDKLMKYQDQKLNVS